NTEVICVRVKFFPLFVVVLVCSFTAFGQDVIESESSVVIGENSADVSLAIENRFGRAERTIELSILDPDGNSRARASATMRLASGKHQYKLAVPLGDLMKKASDQIAWYRLRYRVGDSVGIVSLSEL